MRLIESFNSLRPLLFFNFMDNLFKFYCCFLSWLRPRFDSSWCSWLGVCILWFYSIKSDTWGISFWGFHGWCSFRFLGRRWNRFFSWRYLIYRLFCFVKIPLGSIMFVKILICFCRAWFHYLFWWNFLVFEIFKIWILSIISI